MIDRNAAKDIQIDDPEHYVDRHHALDLIGDNSQPIGTAYNTSGQVQLVKINPFCWQAQVR